MKKIFKHIDLILWIVILLSEIMILIGERQNPSVLGTVLGVIATLLCLLNVLIILWRIKNPKDVTGGVPDSTEGKEDINED